MHDGIIIKATDRNEVLFSNETANAIMNMNERNKRIDSNSMNLKKFKKADLKEGKDPLLEEDINEEIDRLIDGTTPISDRKVSLNHIVKHLEN